MLKLVKGTDLNWGELQFIENPITAKNIVQASNSKNAGGETILNANQFNLPKNTSSQLDAYSEINQKLENGSAFLVNSSTTNPLLNNIKVVEKSTQCNVANCQTEMMKNAIDVMLKYVEVPDTRAILRQEPSGATPADEKPKEEPKKEKKEKEEEPEFKVSIGVQGTKGVGSSDIRVVSQDPDTPIKINNVDKKYGKINVDSVFKENTGHREIALLDVAEGNYFTYFADHTGNGVIPLGEISTLEKETDADFKTALAAVTLMGYEDHTCDASKPMPLRNGYVYIYLNGYLWREIHVDNKGKYKDVNLSDYVNKEGYRRPTHHFDRTVLLPAKINGETPKIQIAFSQCQWTWQRIRQLGGMDPEDMRLKDHPDADVSPLDGSDERRDKRMGAELDLSAWQEGMESSGDKNIMALDGWVDQFESKDDLVDDNNLDKQVGVLFLPETLNWANKAALDHQLAWANFEEFLDDLKNPKHTDPAKKEEFKFAPYFDSAVLAHQYFFAENDDMKKALKSKAIKPKKRQRGPQRYKDAEELIQAIKIRSDWADKLSLPDIERALGMQKRAALRDRILEEKKKLLAILNSDDGNHLNQFKEEIVDFATLAAREDKHQEWAYDQLWALVGKLFDKLARLPAMQDNGLDSAPLTSAQLNEAHVNDVGHQFVFSVLDNNHWLHPIIFPKADPNDPTSPFDEEKSPTDYTCDPNKLNHKINDDRDFEVLRRTAEFISGSLLSYMDVSADVIGDAHIQSTVTLLHSQTTGLKIQREKLNLGQVLEPQLKVSGLELAIPDLPENTHLIRVKFGESKLANVDTLEKFAKKKFKGPSNLVDIPNSGHYASAVIKNHKGSVLGAVSKELIEQGHGLNPGAWEKLQGAYWHTTQADVWVINDQKSLIGNVDTIKPVLKNALLPSLALVELWSIGRAARDFHQEKNIRNNPMALANLVSAVADASGLTIDAMKAFQKYAHAKSAYGKGVRIWDKFLMSQSGYANLAKWAGRANAAASVISVIISFVNMVENILEGDDAWVSHGVMMSGFMMLAYGAVATVGLGFMIAAFGLVLLGAALLKWVFKENDLMEQWLEFGPFSKQGIDEVYSGRNGQMKREPKYTIYTDYGKLILDKQKRLKAVPDMGDFYWEGDRLMLKKIAPLDMVDGVDILEVGRLNGPVDLDALSNKSQRLAVDEYAVVDDWRNHPINSAEDLASLIFQPDFHLEEAGTDLEIIINLNGLVINTAKFEYQFIVNDLTNFTSAGKFSPAKKKLSIPDDIVQLSGHSYKLIWKDFPVDMHSSYQVKYKIDLYGDSKINIPGRYDKDGWIEEWL